MTLLPIHLLGWKSLSSSANSSEDTNPWMSLRPGVFQRRVEFPSWKTSFRSCPAKALGYWPVGGHLRGLTLPQLKACPTWGEGLKEKRRNFSHPYVGGYCENWYLSDVGNNLLYTLPSWWFLGFPGGASGKEPACQCRRCKTRGSMGLQRVGHNWATDTHLTLKWRGIWKTFSS